MLPEMRVFLNGRFCAAAEAAVSVFDHGLLYGDGVFEGIRAYNGRVFKLERHVARLFESARAIRLEIPYTYGFGTHRRAVRRAAVEYVLVGTSS